MAKTTTEEHRLGSLDDLRPDPENPREITPEASAGLEESLHTFGDLSGIVWNKRTGQLVAGHQRLDRLKARYGEGLKLDLGIGVGATAVLRTPDDKGFPVRVVDWDLDRQRLGNLAANNPHIAGTFSRDLQPQLHALLAGEDELLRALRLDLLLEDEATALEPAGPKLAEKFLIPPFSIFDTRQGYWQDRRRQWLALGIRSEIGRGENLLKMSDTVLEPDPKKRAANRLKPNTHLNDEGQRSLGAYQSGGGTLERGDGSFTGTSIFDPVLAEIVYRWFCPEAGQILDPFAGGSVRGIVASMTGRAYTGIDLRRDQVEANQAQARDILSGKPAPSKAQQRRILDPEELTPIEPAGPYWLKRDDYFDLEQYSDDPADLSNLSWEKFLESYRSIIAQSVARLRPNRFACFVVGDVRDEKGMYRNFVDATKAAFLAAGCHFYNEIVLVNAAGSLPLRIGKQFQNYRKVGKMHQNVMVFFKGDPKRIKAEYGEVEVAEVAAEEEAE